MEQIANIPETVKPLDGITKIAYINNDKLIGVQNGLIMSYHNQTFVISPFDNNIDHFTNLSNAICKYGDLVIKLNSSRYVFPYFLRVWEIDHLAVNPASEMTINFPQKNHKINIDNNINGDNKINTIKNIEFNGWHSALPPILMHEINSMYKLGTVLYHNNKITGMIIKHFNSNSIILSMHLLKQVINGTDLNYGNLYYGLKVNNKNQIYVYQDWDIYTNKLKEGDIILQINDNTVNLNMLYEKYSNIIGFDTWITIMFLEYDQLKFKIKRNQ